MRKRNRILACLLLMVLCAALLPAAVLAQNGSGDALISAPADTTKHTVTFIAGGEVFATVLVPDGDRLGNMPKVPEKEGYTGQWDKTVDLVTASVPVTAIYTPIHTAVADNRMLWLVIPVALLSVAAMALTVKLKEN